MPYRIEISLKSYLFDAEGESIRKKAKNKLKKIQRVLWGREKITIELSDPRGNSAIVSEKAVKN